jgi:hypothetical protein
MQTMRPSPDWEVLLAPFQSLFTKPGFRYFRAFVLVFAHLDGRLWVTRVILSGLLSRHYTNFYRFLASPAWSPQEVAKQVFRLSLGVGLQPGNRVCVALDDTVAKKSGKRFDSLGVHHDPMNKQHPKRLSPGHCFVCLALLGQPVVGHFVALFVSCALYVQKAACRKGQEFATKLALGARLLADLPVPPGLFLIAVCDGAYAKHAFVAPVVAGGRHVLSRLRSDTVFYDLPPARKKRSNGKYPPGAPKKYGKKHKAQTWAARLGTWTQATLLLYGRPVTLRLKTRVVKQRTLGVTIRLVAVQWENHPLVFLFCTDPTLSAGEIVSFYCARFAIETGFRDAKQHFGLATYQVRRETRFVRLLHLCLWAQTLLRLVCWHKKPEPVYGAWRKALGYLTLSQQKRLSQSQCRVFAGSMEPLGTLENAPEMTVAI